MSGRRLYRSEKERMLMGVCGGISHYLGIDPTFIRLFFILFTMANGVGIILYLVLALLMPVAPPEEDHPHEDGFSLDLSGEKTGNILGIALVVFGVVALLGSFDVLWLNWISVRNFFPLLLVGLGFWVLLGKKNSAE